MDRKRSIAYGTIFLGLALGSGQWLTNSKPNAPIVLPAPQELAASASLPTPAERPVAPAPQLVQTPAEAEPAMSGQITHVVPVAAVADIQTDTVPAANQAIAPPADTAPDTTADACAPVLDLIAEPDAMIGITLVAPCQAGARVVLSHGGLAVTARATATGSVFTSLPAMDAEGAVTVLFPDGSKASAALAMPEVTNLRRFAVQWQARDKFDLNAFDGEATYGSAGHASPVAFETLAATDGVTGKVVSFGDASVELPLLAQVYTFPAGTQPSLTVEAEVTGATCDRELLGETLESAGGRVETRELTLPMPDCEAVGEFLVLKIPAPDLTLALAE